MYGYSPHHQHHASRHHRKPPLGKKAPPTMATHHRKRVVEREGILEVISCDETEPVTVDGSSYSWSLSSNSIITTWLLEHDDDDDDDDCDNDGDNDDEDDDTTTWDGVHIETSLSNGAASIKTIQSFTSNSDKVFSPVYEVTAGEQNNVFKESHKPLPKPGQTPKFGNLSYGRGSMFGNLSYKSSSDAAEESCSSAVYETRDRSEKTPKLGNLSRSEESFARAGAAAPIAILRNESPTTHTQQKQKAADPMSTSYFYDEDMSSPANESPVSSPYNRFGWPKRRSPTKYLHGPNLKNSVYTTSTAAFPPTKLAGRFPYLSAPTSTRSESESPYRLRRQLSSHSHSSSSTRAQAVLQSLDDDSPTDEGLSLREIRLHSSKAAQCDPPSEDRRKLIERQRRLSLRRGATTVEERNLEKLRRELHLRLGKRNQRQRREQNGAGGESPVSIGKRHQTASQPNDDAQREPFSTPPIDWQETDSNDENDLLYERKAAKTNTPGSRNRQALCIEPAAAFSGSSSESATGTRPRSSCGYEDKQSPSQYTCYATSKGRHGFASRFDAVCRKHVRKDSKLSVGSVIDMKSLADEDDSSGSSTNDEESELSKNKAEPGTNDSAPEDHITAEEHADAGMPQARKKEPTPPENREKTIRKEHTPTSKVQEKANRHALLHTKRWSSTPAQASATIKNDKTLEGYIRGEWRLSAGSNEATTGTEDWSQELGVLPESNICEEVSSKTPDLPHLAQKEKDDPELEGEEGETETGTSIECEQDTSVAKLVDVVANEEVTKSCAAYAEEPKRQAPSLDRNQDWSANQQAFTDFRGLPPTFCEEMTQTSLQALYKITVDAALAPTLCCAVDKTRPRSLEFTPLFDPGPMRCTVTLGDKKKDGANDGERQIIARRSNDVILGDKEKDGSNDEERHLVARRSNDDFKLSYLFPTRRLSPESPAAIPNLSAPFHRSCVTVNREAFRVLLGSWRHQQPRKSITPMVASSSSKPAMRKASVSPKAGRKPGRRKRSMSSDFSNDLVQDTELRDLISDTNALFSAVSGSPSNPASPHSSSRLCIVDEDDDRLVLDPKALTVLTDEEHGESSVEEDSSVLGDKELRAVMKLTHDGDNVSALFPTFSSESQSYCDSDDGLDREWENLLASEASLRKEIERALTVDPTATSYFGSALNTPAESTVSISENSSMVALGEVNERGFSSDSSMANFNDVLAGRSSMSSAAVNVLQEEVEDSTRRVRFDDNIQEHIFENQSEDDPKWTRTTTPSERLCNTEETFLDEVVGVFEELIEEMGALCVTTSKVLDRGSMIRPTAGKGKGPRRSMAG